MACLIKIIPKKSWYITLPHVLLYSKVHTKQFVKGSLLSHSVPSQPHSTTKSCIHGTKPSSDHARTFFRFPQQIFFVLNNQRMLLDIKAMIAYNSQTSQKLTWCSKCHELQKKRKMNPYSQYITKTQKSRSLS